MDQLTMYSENEFGMSVKRCCASCAHKELTGRLKDRECKEHDCLVRPRNVCLDWVMDKPSQRAGATEGRVKKREYLMYLLEVREREYLAEKQGNRVTPLTISEIRQLFEKEQGSIYLSLPPSQPSVAKLPSPLPPRVSPKREGSKERKAAHK
ncbi:MAG: hypothetical protein K5842_05640 [Bacteroidales bacterium]|nr:hypothetical protein [Bacteroidales bacterium]